MNLTRKEKGAINTAIYSALDEIGAFNCSINKKIQNYVGIENGKILITDCRPNLARYFVLNHAAKTVLFV